jgi:hypothetical protein
MGIRGDAATSCWVWVVDDVASSVAHRWRSCTVAAEVAVVVYCVILLSLSEVGTHRLKAVVVGSGGGENETEWCG